MGRMMDGTKKHIAIFLGLVELMTPRCHNHLNFLGIRSLMMEIVIPALYWDLYVLLQLCSKKISFHSPVTEVQHNSFIA